MDPQAAAVTLVPAVVTALYATASHSALVIDCGWAETRVLPVFKGIPLQHLYKSTSAFLACLLRH
jgi:actin-related protein